MLLGDIRVEVQLALNDDPAFTDDIVDGYINTVYSGVVASCLVPDLKGIDTVVTDLVNPYVVLSGLEGGFSGVLSRVYNGSYQRIAIMNKLDLLMDLGGTLTDVGDVVAVALEGSTLWYYALPSVATTLTVMYYKNPEVLVLDNDVPVNIPEFLHRQILVNGAASIAWNAIEDGLDGMKVNTNSREMMKEQGVVRMREWLGKTRKHYVSSQVPA